MKLTKYIPDEFRNVNWREQLAGKKIWFLLGLGTWFGYICFNHPFTWNFRTQKLCFVTGSFHRMVRKFYIFLAVSFTVMQAISIAYDFSQGEFDITTIFGMYRALSVAYCTFPVVIQINVAMMPEEEIQVCNYSMDYWTIMQRDVFANPGKANKFDLKNVLIMLMVGSNIFFTQQVGLAAYIVDCRFHPLSSAFPICDADAYNGTGTWHLVIGHPNFVIFSISFIYLWAVTTQLVCATIGFMFMVICPILGCQEVLGKMNTPVNELPEGDAFRDKWNWLIHYRILQMLLTRVNLFVGQYVIPIVLLLCISLNIGINYILLGIEGEPMFKVAGVVINVVLIATTTFTVKQAAGFVELSEDAVKLRRIALKDSRKDEDGFCRSLDTCRPLLTDIGPFMKMEKLTILEIYAVINEYTTELILLDE